jgi:hypothetical protein
MARKNKNKLAPFIPLFLEELSSEAYRTLPGNAAKAFAYFRRIDWVKRYRSRNEYNGIFDFTYSEAAMYGFARSTFNRIITALLEKGFIDIITQGGKRGCGMSNSKYRISQRWRDYGKAVFIKKCRYPSEPPSMAKG